MADLLLDELPAALEAEAFRRLEEVEQAWLSQAFEGDDGGFL